MTVSSSLATAAHDLVGVLAQPLVVAAHALLRVRLGVVAEGEVGQRAGVRLALPARLAPRGLELLARLGERVGRRPAGDPAVGLGGAAEGRVDLPADHQLGRVVRHVGPDASGEALLVAGPDALHLGQHLVEALAALVVGDARGLVVVLARTHRRTQHQPPAGQVLHCGGLLGQQGGVHSVGGDQDAGEQLDPLGDRGGRRERHQGLVVAVDHPVEHP